MPPMMHSTLQFSSLVSVSFSLDHSPRKCELSTYLLCVGRGGTRWPCPAELLVLGPSIAPQRFVKAPLSTCCPPHMGMEQARCCSCNSGGRGRWVTVDLSCDGGGTERSPETQDRQALAEEAGSGQGVPGGWTTGGRTQQHLPAHWKVRSLSRDPMSAAESGCWEGSSAGGRKLCVASREPRELE